MRKKDRYVLQLPDSLVGLEMLIQIVASTENLATNVAAVGFRTQVQGPDVSL